MKKIGGSCFRTKGKPRLEELSDKFHSSKSSAESKSVTESSGFDSKARIMVSWSGRKRTSSILILLTTVGKRVNNLAKEQWFDCTIRWSIVEKPINFPPLPLPQLSVSHHFDSGRGEKEVTHYSSWNFAPTSVSNEERSGDEREKRRNECRMNRV